MLLTQLVHQVVQSLNPTKCTHAHTHTHTQFLVDDLLVHSGTVPPVPSHARGILPTLHPPIDPHVISFGGQDLVGAGKLVCRSAKSTVHSN